MAERRSLVEGLSTVPPVDRELEKKFVYAGKAEAPRMPAKPAAVAPVIGRSPITTRMRDDYAKALKRASLERQLAGVVPNTLQDILEEAIGPWLEDNGYLAE